MNNPETEMLAGRKCPLQKTGKLELDTLLQVCVLVILTKYAKWVYMLKKLPHTSFCGRACLHLKAESMRIRERLCSSLMTSCFIEPNGSTSTLSPDKTCNYSRSMLLKCIHHFTATTFEMILQGKKKLRPVCITCCCTTKCD